jgi:hypothetical protein
MRIDAAVAREAKAMTTKEVIVKAIEKKLSWVQAADILGYTPRHMLRLKQRWVAHGYDGIRDQRGRTPRRRRIPLATIARLCALKRRHVTSHGHDPVILTSMTQGPETGSGHSIMIRAVVNGASVAAVASDGWGGG